MIGFRRSSTADHLRQIRYRRSGTHIADPGGSFVALEYPCTRRIAKVPDLHARAWSLAGYFGGMDDAEAVHVVP